MGRCHGPNINSEEWERSPYQPTPTIIEAARRLYDQHSVAAISRSGTDVNITCRQIERLIKDCQTERRKAIVFVTGVPGAGKTLVGLNIATRNSAAGDSSHAVYLSGNGPLVEVLQEALTRDEFGRLRSKGEKVRKGEVKQKVKAFIQNVHHFRDEGLRNADAPSDHVVIFDEAQRAWNREMTSDFMRRKKNRPGFSQSEPEFLISYLDRHNDWAVIVCLVGGGQEINRGEAGISEWLDAVRASFCSWRVYISPDLTDSEYAAGHAVERLRGVSDVIQNKELHLSVSMRAFRAEGVSSFIKAVLDKDPVQAEFIFAEIKDRYPLYVTRDLSIAKKWLVHRARGSERFGLVASSSAQRLKPHAIDVRVAIDPVHWFLSERGDVRSSYQLEDAATEFQVQGLELDWACVTWDGDLRYADGGWSFHDFRGSKWINIANLDNRSYLRNAYRVLLTRARQGMVIFVPPGDARDPTRAANIYDPTYDYLVGLGIQGL